MGRQFLSQLHGSELNPLPTLVAQHPGRQQPGDAGTGSGYWLLRWSFWLPAARAVVHLVMFAPQVCLVLVAPVERHATKAALQVVSALAFAAVARDVVLVGHHRAAQLARVRF